jgi:hypothetical protein
MADLNGSRSNPREGAPVPPIQHIRLIVEAGLISRFLKLTERGFKLQIKTGLTIRELLCQHLSISEDYVDNRIQTIFLDGKPVDDVDTASLENGSRLALSAAMPGLVGITFRKGGFYAALRSSISYTKTDNLIVKGAGEIVLKLFNMVARELGPELLEKGIRIEGHVFHHFMLRNSEDLKAASTSVHLNDKKIDVDGFLEMNWENTDIFLKITPEQKL